MKRFLKKKLSILDEVCFSGLMKYNMTVGMGRLVDARPTATAATVLYLHLCCLLVVVVAKESLMFDAWSTNRIIRF
jgi:hypothetical protein